MQELAFRCIRCKNLAKCELIILPQVKIYVVNNFIFWYQILTIKKLNLKFLASKSHKFHSIKVFQKVMLLTRVSV